MRDSKFTVLCTLSPNFDEMLSVFHFLCEDVGKILMARDVFDCKKIPFDVLTDDIFPHLHVSESFSCCPFTPVDAGSVVIVDRCCCARWEEKITVLKVVNGV